MAESNKRSIDTATMSITPKRVENKKQDAKTTPLKEEIASNKLVQTKIIASQGHKNHQKQCAAGRNCKSVDEIVMKVFCYKCKKVAHEECLVRKHKGKPIAGDGVCYLCIAKVELRNKLADPNRMDEDGEEEIVFLKTETKVKAADTQSDEESEEATLDGNQNDSSFSVSTTRETGTKLLTGTSFLGLNESSIASEYSEDEKPETRQTINNPNDMDADEDGGPEDDDLLFVMGDGDFSQMLDAIKDREGREFSEQQLHAMANITGVTLDLSHVNRATKLQLLTETKLMVNSDDFDKNDVAIYKLEILYKYLKMHYPRGKISMKKHLILVNKALNRLKKIKDPKDIEMKSVQDMAAVTGVFLPDMCFNSDTRHTILQEVIKVLSSKTKGTLSVDRYSKEVLRTLLDACENGDENLYTVQPNISVITTRMTEQEILENTPIAPAASVSLAHISAFASKLQQSKQALTKDTSQATKPIEECTYAEALKIAKAPADPTIPAMETAKIRARALKQMIKASPDTESTSDEIAPTSQKLRFQKEVESNTPAKILPVNLYSKTNLGTPATPKSILKTNEYSTRFDIRIEVPFDLYATSTVDHVFAQIGQIIGELRKSDSSILVLPWSTKDAMQSPLDMEKKLTGLNELQRFFNRVRNIEQGKTYGEMRLSHNRRWAEILYDTGIWLNEKGHGVYHKSLQVEKSYNVGWLMWSFRAIDTELLKYVLLDTYGITVSLRYAGVSLGNGPIIDNPVRALHVAAESGAPYTKAKAVLQRIYGLSATAFPLGILLRYVPTTAQLGRVGLNMVKKLRRKQQLFLELIEGRNAKCWEINILDSGTAGKPSLRELLMRVYSDVEPTKSLFVSVDTAFNNQELVLFTYLPRFENEVRGFLGVMVPYMLKLHGQEISSYFSVEAVARASDVEFDGTTNEIITKDDKYLAAFASDEDMSYFGFEFSEDVTAQLTHENNKVERIYLGEEVDSVGTFSSKKARLELAALQKTKPMTAMETARAQHSIARERHAINFIPKSGATVQSNITESDRLTVVEDSLGTLTSDIKQINAKFDQLIALQTVNNNAKGNNNVETGTHQNDGTGEHK